MSSLLALLLFASAPASPAPVAVEAPARPQARAMGVARARIVAPVRLRLSADGELSSGENDTGARLITYQQSRRDGARIVDCY